MQAIGGLIGGIANNGDEKRAKEAREKALAAIEGINLPTIEEQQLALQNLVNQGDMTPEMLQTIGLQDSAMENISGDPRLRSAQMSALEKLSQQGETGLSASDRLALTQIGKENERATKARNDSVLQNMAQRGMSGSGAELAAQLMNSQNAAENAQMQGMNVAAQAQQRALEATAQGANLAGNVRGQDFDQASATARAQDAINQFNAANRQNVAGVNVSNRNNATANNLQNKQRIADVNVGNANQQQMHNKDLIQQQLNNQMNLGGMKSNALTGQANQYQQQADKAVDRFVGYGKAVDETLASAAKAAALYGGGQVKGKAKHEGDHPENDTVPALLSPGEIVIPNSVLQEAESKSDEVITNFIKKARKK